ncbi:UPF0182 family protein [Allobranchiibius sp. CTAmp26]|uniref:UPF0182 family protein n=1 Tax=Allobranchiibius sp. CTAmp26 TaxID=2815214 RepID=UPI001AA111CD|nr:UPF0182 family protein [Allobranchiibius sp. CTAmp26]MBO1755730.1 UPF0182 family protein [Allobranchiibius sp. CTAmp26]
MSAADGSGRSGGAGSSDVRALPRLDRRRHSLLRLTVTVVAVLVGGNIAVNLWTQHLWFENLQYAGVYGVELRTRAALFAAGFLLVEVLCHGSVWLAYRYRPIRVPDAAGEAMHRYRVAIEPFRRAAFAIVPLLLAVLTGVSASSQWQTPLLWWARQSFGQTDPQFHRDIGFYVFTMPFIEMLIGFGTVILILALVLATVTHYIYGGITVTEGRLTVTRVARRHLCLLALALLLVRAAGWWWGRYALVYRTGRTITGVDDTDVRSTLPVHAILACAAVLTALAFLITLRTRSWRWPAAAVSMLMATAVAFGGIYPEILSAVRGSSIRSASEATYLQRQIDGTRTAYGVSDVTVRDYTAGATPTAGLAAAAAGAPVLDPTVVTNAFQQLQGLTPPAAFGGLDVGRTGSGTAAMPTVVGARGVDVSGLPANRRDWVGQHLIYTHGTGVVTARADVTTAGGAPSFLTDSAASRSRIYFGAGLPSYSVVGGKPIEADGTASTGFRYDGRGGVALGGVLRRLAYAAKFRSLDLLTSRAVSTSSRVIYERDPVDRVRQVAPWLSVDDDAYPVQSGAHTLWVVDGYTTSDHYPYSEHQPLTTASGALGRPINYLRASVKATVDAYDGTVRLYAWDSSEPVLRAWEKVFPGTVRPRSQLPAAVLSQVRYPQGQFEMQRTVLAAYHVSDRATFADGRAHWSVPVDPTTGAGVPQPSYYQPVTLPGASGPGYALTSTYVGEDGTGQATGYLVAGSDHGTTPGQVGAGYGRLTLLRISGSARGPGQFQDDLNSSAQRSSSMPGTLSQFFITQSRQKAVVSKGDLLTLPAAGGILQIEPLYVVAEGSAYPVLKAVVVGFGGRLRWGATLQDALTDLSTAP